MKSKAAARRYNAHFDDQMREFHKSFGIDPQVTERAIEVRRQNPADDDPKQEIQPARSGSKRGRSVKLAP